MTSLRRDVDSRTLQRGLSADGALTRAMEGLTGGAVLAGLLIALGAGDATIALVAAVPFLAQLAQMPALHLAFRVRSRRKLTLLASAASRSLLLIAGVVIAIAPAPTILWILVALLALSALSAAVAAFAWAYWMRDLVPGHEYGTLFARRFAWQALVTLGATLAAGAYLTSTNARGSPAFAALFILGSLVGLASLAFVARLPDVGINPADGPASLRLLLGRLRARGERRPLLFAGLWGLGATMAVPFIPIFLLRELGASYVLVATLGALSVLSALVTAASWGRLADRAGSKPVLAFCAAVSGVAILGLVLVESLSPGGLVVLGAAHLVMGATLAGVEVALGKLIARSAPFNHAGGFLATAGMARAMGAGLGILVAGVVATISQGPSLLLSLHWASLDLTTLLGSIRVGHYDWVFLLAGLGMLYAAHRVLGLDEPEARGDVDVLRELHVELAGLSPFRGARAVSRLAHHAARLIHERRRATSPQPRAWRPP